MLLECEAPASRELVAMGGGSMSDAGGLTPGREGSVPLATGFVLGVPLLHRTADMLGVCVIIVDFTPPKWETADF